jgi:hypothetical protein
MPSTSRTLLFSLLTASLAAACTDDPAPGESKRVELRAPRAELLSFRPEGDGWRTLSPGGNGIATVEVDRPFSVASVCQATDYVTYHVVHAAPEDGDRFEIECEAPAPSVATVLIDAAQVGTIYVGATGYEAGASTELAAGTYDVVAIDDSVTPPRVVIRRGVELVEETTLLIDVSEGTPMTPATVTIAGAEPGAVIGGMRFNTANGTWARRTTTAGQTYLIPAELIIAGDRQFVSMYEIDGNVDRSSNVMVGGDETAVTVELPAGITAASRTLGEEPSVTWTTTEAYEDRFVLLASDDYTVRWDATMHAGYAEAMGTADSITIPDPTVLQGWDPAWALGDGDGDWWVSLSTTDGAGNRRGASWKKIDAAAR